MGFTVKYQIQVDELLFCGNFNVQNPCYFGVVLNLLDNILQFLNGLFIKRSFFLIEYFLSPAFPCNEHDSAPNFSIHTIICTHTRSTIDKVTQVHDRAVIKDAF